MASYYISSDISAFFTTAFLSAIFKLIIIINKIIKLLVLNFIINRCIPFYILALRKGEIGEMIFSIIANSQSVVNAIIE